MEAVMPVTRTSFISKVYGWMCLGLFLTALVSVKIFQMPGAVQYIFGNKVLLFGLFMSEILLVVILASRVTRMSGLAATTIFLVYSGINGLTLSVIFVAYTKESIASTFFITAATFGVMSVYGFITKRDLTSIGNICIMALIGLIIATIANIFIASTALYWITTYVGILIFVGLIAYDTQKLKNIAVDEGSEDERRLSIIGALALYLDFINLFLLLLRLFGVNTSKD